MSWEQIFCHPSVRTAVINASKHQMLDQTTIIYGNPGAGQETVARSIAKTILCPQVEHDFCGKCYYCKKIDDTKYPLPDYFELKIAQLKRTTYGINQIREIQENAVLHPYEANYRIFVINECHRMTLDASNCFLKLLEEPYPHNVFILTTDTISAILPTIISRCRKLRLPATPVNQLKEKLNALVDSESKAETLSRFSGGYLEQAEMWQRENFFSIRDEVFGLLQDQLQSEAYTAKMVDAFQTASKNKEIVRKHIRMRLAILVSFLRDAVTYSCGSDNPIYIHTDLADEYPQLWQSVPASHWIASFERALDIFEDMSRYLNMNAQLTELFILIRNPERSLT